MKTDAARCEPQNALFLYCRAGFESECAQEIQQRAAEKEIAGYAQTNPASGYVLFHCYGDGAAAELYKSISLNDLIFARQWFVVRAHCVDLARDDRVTPLISTIKQFATRFHDWFIDTPDSEATKPLTALCRGLGQPIKQALTKAGAIIDQPEHGQRLHICFVATDRAYVGVGTTDGSAPWPMGIPRLKASPEAPSRSALKLEEALLRFVSEEKLQPGMHAVDLGAAPGGWTWVLMRRHVRVIAVDNGKIAPALLESGLVEHQATDAFKFQPAHKKDWMVCDVVEQPIRNAELTAHWLREGWCRFAIVNLKLPMKKRFQEVLRCLEHIQSSCAETGVSVKLHCKQLYHDREEVTLFAERVSSRRA